MTNYQILPSCLFQLCKKAENHVYSTEAKLVSFGVSNSPSLGKLVIRLSLSFPIYKIEIMVPKTQKGASEG